MSDNLQLKYRLTNNYLPKSSNRQLVMLTGARQTGKTTLAKSRYPELRYINLDSPENRDIIRKVSSSLWSKDIGNAIIDEAQKEPSVFEKIKYSYDEGGISFSCILGSSQILLLKKIRESLAGRISIYELWPLLMSEIYNENNNSSIKAPLCKSVLFSKDDFNNSLSSVPSVLINKDDSLARSAEEYLLKWGGMPALLPLKDEERWKWLKDYEYTYLERDLADLARLDDLEPFRKFQKLSALRSGGLLNYSELARDASIGTDTARRYLEYLRLSYQVALIQPYYKNVTSSAVKTPKLYWLDIGLLRELSGYKGELSGQIYETMVVGELMKWIKTSQDNSEIYFYRTRSGMEVDVILQTENGIIGIEIKSRKMIANIDYSPLKEIALKLGDAWRGGLVVYQGDEIKKIAEPSIWAVPSRRLFI